MKSAGWMIVLLLILLTGCSAGQETAIHEAQPETPRTMEESTETAQTGISADVVDKHGMVDHIELLDAFVDNPQGTQPQRLIRYTIEGDPIYYDLTRANGKVELRVDTTEDEFGKGEVRTYSCDSLIREETDTQIRYALPGCEGHSEDMELLQVPFDVSQQDRFEFVLKYGPDLTNEINTVEHELQKDLGNDRMMHVSDFGIPEKDRQNIYRELVLAAYLNEKKLSSVCKQQEGERYDLKVLINGGERHFQWNSCDTGADGLHMTAVVEKMIAIIENGSMDPL